MKIRPLVLAAAAASVLAAAPQAFAAEYVPGEVLVGPAASASAAASSRSATVVKTRSGETVREAVRRLRGKHGYAVPNYIARASGFVPNDTGIGAPTEWQNLQ